MYEQKKMSNDHSSIPAAPTAGKSPDHGQLVVIGSDGGFGDSREPCEQCVDHTKGSMSDRRCSMCSRPAWPHFKRHPLLSSNTQDQPTPGGAAKIKP